VIDARSGRIVRFVPALQWNDDYERMRYVPGQELPSRDVPAPIVPRGGLDDRTDNLPPPTVIKADPRLLHAMPVVPSAPSHENRSASLAPSKPAGPAPHAAAPIVPQSAAAQPKPAEPKLAPQCKRRLNRSRQPHCCRRSRCRRRRGWSNESRQSFYSAADQTKESSPAQAGDPVDTGVSIFTTVSAYWMPRFRGA
jgi:hypothetical protein